MQVKVTEVEYINPSTELPVDFEFDLSEEIVNDDTSLSNEVVRLIKEKTGADVLGCLIDV
jgi:hypothetical protein